MTSPIFRMFFIHIILSVSIPVVCVFAEDAPTMYNSYDGAVIGARAIGMGEAFVALSDNADSVYWNPAGLIQIPGNLCTIGLNIQTVTKEELNEVLNKDPLKGGKLIYLSFAGNQGGLSWRPLSNFKQNTYTENVQTNTKTWEEKEIKVNQFIFSLAVPYTEQMTIGFNISYLIGNLAISNKSKTGDVWDEPSANVSSGNGFGLDFGLLYKFTPYMKLGIMCQNVASYMYWDDYARDRLPFNLRIGNSVKLSNLLTFSYDFEKRFYIDADNVEIYHMGLEHLFFKTVAIRYGVYGNDWNKAKEVTYTFGMGYFQNNHFIDLAFKKYFVNLASPGETPVYTDEPVYTYICSVTIPF